MNVCRRTAVAIALCAALPAGPTWAAASGHCLYEGRKVVFVDGAAWQVPAEEPDEDGDDGFEDYVETDDEGNPLPPPGPEYMLGFTTFKIDHGALARSTDREEGIRDQSWDQDESARLELTMQDGEVGQQYLWISPGTNISYSSSEVGKYTVGKARAGTLAGRYRFTPEDGQELDCDLSFELEVLGDPKDAPPPPGKPLPPGGGAPGAAYLAMNKALHDGDVDAMMAMMPADRVEEFKELRKSPEFAVQLALAKAMSPSQVRITGGRQHEDRAWVEFTAVESDTPRVGTAEMQLVEGRWIMLKESTRDP